MARRPTNRQRRRQSEATNPVQSEIQQVLAAEPGWTKRFQLPSPPEFQEVRTERRRSCPAVLPFRARARAWSNNRQQRTQDRKSTRLNSSHEWISYAVFCLKKKTKR